MPQALALGARAVLVGRPYLWGLAVAGEERVLTVTGNRLSLEVVAAPCRSGPETSLPSQQAMR